MAITSALVKVILPLFAILGAVLLYNHGPDGSLTTIKSIISPVADQTPISPHSASWRSWYHPLQSQQNHRTKSLKKEWNILHHLGGNGPWVEKLDEGGTTPDLAPPPGCSIDQVHMVGDSNGLNRLLNTG
jgi:acid phosphatase